MIQLLIGQWVQLAGRPCTRFLSRKNAKCPPQALLSGTSCLFASERTLLTGPLTIISLSNPKIQFPIRIVCGFACYDCIFPPFLSIHESRKLVTTIIVLSDYTHNIVVFLLLLVLL